MTTLFWTQFSALFFVSHLLASATVLSQRKPNRHRKTTATTWTMPSLSLVELQTTPAYLHESQYTWDTGVSVEQNGYKRFTRKPAQNRKVRRNETSLEIVTPTASPKHRVKHLSITTTDRTVSQFENVSRSVDIQPIITIHQQISSRTKSGISLLGNETSSTSGHYRNPRVRTSTTTTGLPTSVTLSTQVLSSSSTSNMVLHTARTTFEGKSNEPESKTSLEKDNRDCLRACDMSLCPQVEAESCKGRVVKDSCNCCPVCLVESALTNYSKGDLSSKKPYYYPSNACDGMVCKKNRVCILNIQGIPMCRCPNIYSCRNGERKPLCAQNGVTFKNKCFLKVEECTTSRRIRVLHKGACRHRPVTTQGPSTQNRAELNVRTNSYARMQDGSKRKPGKNSKNAGNWRDASAQGEKRAYENRHKKRFGTGARQNV